MAVFTGSLNISNGISFSLNTDINDGNVEFTLNYTTSGGPATNVTWTSQTDHTLLPLESSVLVNAITAEYIHTLKVTGRKGGLYTSIVMNNKPSSISTSLLVKGKKCCSIGIHTIHIISEASPPRDVYVDASEDSNTVIVSWSIPSGGDSVIGYQLYYQHVNTVTTINISSHDHTAVFTEGNERVYSVSIQSLSEHLPSDLVGPIIARGKSDNNVLSCLISL